MLKLITTFLLTTIAILTIAQNADSFSISGKVISANSGKPIVAASIIIDKNNGTFSDTEGNFLIRGIQNGKYKLSFRCIDFAKKDTLVTIENQSIKDLVLTVPANCKSYNERKAIKDIKQEKAIVFVNIKLSQSNPTANKQFKDKYGIDFEFNDFGLPADDCMTIYNQIIFEYLDNQFGKQWRDEINENAVGLK